MPLIDMDTTFYVVAAIHGIYVLAGIALFVTGKSPFTTPNTDLHEDTFTTIWAGWKMSGVLYVGLVNMGFDLSLVTAVVMFMWVVVDVGAVYDKKHWNILIAAFIFSDGLMGCMGLATSTDPSMKWAYVVAGVVATAYCGAGVVAMSLGYLPVGNVFAGGSGPGGFFPMFNKPEVALDSKRSFAVAWAGWKFAGCAFVAMMQFAAAAPESFPWSGSSYDAKVGLSNFVFLILYVLVDVYATRDTAHWTPLAYGFVTLDSFMAVSSLVVATDEGSSTGLAIGVGAGSAVVLTGLTIALNLIFKPVPRARTESFIGVADANP
jgi:hypothetical protein